jgi:hypothetical protein
VASPVASHTSTLKLIMDMQELREELDTIKKKVGDIYDALLGNGILKDGGLVGKIKHIESEQMLMKVEIAAIKKGYEKIEVYQKIMWGAMGTVSGLVIAYCIQQWFSK